MFLLGFVVVCFHSPKPERLLDINLALSYPMVTLRPVQSGKACSLYKTHDTMKGKENCSLQRTYIVCINDQLNHITGIGREHSYCRLGNQVFQLLSEKTNDTMQIE